MQRGKKYCLTGKLPCSEVLSVCTVLPRHVYLNPLTANHNNCHLLCYLLVILKVIFANGLDPDQTAPRSSLIRVHTVCLYAKVGLKSLQEYSAENINRRHFQMQVFLAF